MLNIQWRYKIEQKKVFFGSHIHKITWENDAFFRLYYILPWGLQFSCIRDNKESSAKVIYPRERANFLKVKSCRNNREKRERERVIICSIRLCCVWSTGYREERMSPPPLPLAPLINLFKHKSLEHHRGARVALWILMPPQVQISCCNNLCAKHFGKLIVERGKTCDRVHIIIYAQVCDDNDCEESIITI